MLACMLSCFSCVWLFVTLWTVAHQTSLSTGFYRQEYWNGLPCPFSGDLPDWEIRPASLMSAASAGSSLPQVLTEKSCRVLNILKISFYMTCLYKFVFLCIHEFLWGNENGGKKKNGLRRQFESKMNSICDQFNVERSNEKEREKSAFKF